VRPSSPKEPSSLIPLLLPYYVPTSLFTCLGDAPSSWLPLSLFRPRYPHVAHPKVLSSSHHTASDPIVASLYVCRCLPPQMHRTTTLRSFIGSVTEGWRSGVEPRLGVRRDCVVRAVGSASDI